MSAKSIIVVIGKWDYPKGGVVYRIGRPDSIKGLLRVLCALVVQKKSEVGTSEVGSRQLIATDVWFLIFDI